MCLCLQYQAKRVCLNSSKEPHRGKEKNPTHRCRFSRSASVCISLCLPLRKPWKENKSRSVREAQTVMEPCSSHRWHHTDWAGGVREFGPQPHFLHSRSNVRAALCYLSGCSLLSVWLGSLCLSAHPPRTQYCYPSRAAPALASSPVEKERTWREGKGKLPKRSHVGNLSVALTSELGWRLSLTLTLDPYPYRCSHIPYMLHIRVKQITWDDERFNFDLVLLTGQDPVIHNCYNRVFPQAYVITSAHLLHMSPTSVPNPDSFQAPGWASNIPNEAADIKESRRGNEKHLFCSHKCNDELLTPPSHGWRPHNCSGERVLGAFLEKR